MIVGNGFKKKICYTTDNNNQNTTFKRPCYGYFFRGQHLGNF